MALNRSLYWHSAKVAIIVGTLLNAINQPQLFLAIALQDFTQLQEINCLKLMLTYAVPFFVSFHGAISALGLPDL